PGDLAQLGGDLDRHLVRVGPAPEVERAGEGDAEADQAGVGPGVGPEARRGQRLGDVPEAEDGREQMLEEGPREQRQHDVADRHQTRIRHRFLRAGLGAGRRVGRPGGTRTPNMRFWRPPLYHWSYWPSRSLVTSSPC